MSGLVPNDETNTPNLLVPGTKSGDASTAASMLGKRVRAPFWLITPVAGVKIDDHSLDTPVSSLVYSSEVALRLMAAYRWLPCVLEMRLSGPPPLSGAEYSSALKRRYPDHTTHPCAETGSTSAEAWVVRRT